jgi:outer membrane biosynthesis protein TonB
MPARGLHGLWLRGVAAAAACLLALGSTGALVAAAVVAPTGQGSAISLTSQSHTVANSSNRNSNGTGDAKVAPPDRKPSRLEPTHGKPTPEPKTHKPTPTPKPAEHPTPTPKPAEHPTPARRLAPSHPASHAASPATPAPTAKVVVDSTDPAPFAAQAVAAADATRVVPVERLGPLSGISFGSGLFIWPLLLAVDVLALAVIARMALRRRLASPED